MQEGGGSQYGVPPPEEVTPFATAAMGARAQMLGVPSLEQLQQSPQQQKAGSCQQQQLPPAPMRAGGANLEEVAAPEALEGGFPDEDVGALAGDDVAAAAGEEAERGVVGSGGGGNRWPREETLALLRIRSEMDAVFRDASFKCPLWEDVSRKLAELGYNRSAKKCKEKFENVHKYYKRTKDGKSYRFLPQLEALHGSRTGGATGANTESAAIPSVPTQAAGSTVAIGIVGSGAGRLQPTPLNAIPLSVGAVVRPPMAAGTNSPAVFCPSGRVSFSSSASGSEEEDMTEECLPREPRKRKRAGGCGGDGVGGSSTRKMMAFFEGLVRQVMERQESMQQKFLEMIEKREEDRMIREEAWRRQEMARLSREHEAMAQEREIAASRDAAIIAFLQKMTRQAVPTPTFPPVAPAHPVPAQPLSQLHQALPPEGHQPQAHQQYSIHGHSNEISRYHLASPPEMAIPPSTDAQDQAAGAGGGGSGMDPASSRWPKSEVHALIKLRRGMDTRYQEAGPKGPLWEEIAVGMRRMGYNRSAKRCKEKWENINKYFKKVKDSSKKRPEDAKTCPYFHQLDALYQKKTLISSGAGGGSSLGNHVSKQEPEGNPCPSPVSRLALPQQSQAEAEAKSSGDGSHRNGSSSNPDGNGALTEQAQHRNGGIVQDEGVSRDESSKELPDRLLGPHAKPEDTMKGPVDLPQHAAMDVDYDKMNETESDSMDLPEEDVDDGEDDVMAYRVEYQQRPAGVNGTSNGAGGNPSAAASFVAMVQ